MRILIDTNVLISAILFPNESMDRLIRTVTEDHRLVLSSFVIDELVGVVKKKFKSRMDAVDRFLGKFPYEMVYTPRKTDSDLFKIRDEKDFPVLYGAIIEDVDILITGDKDFFDIEIDKPEILTPKQFLEKYSY
jgi:putative PIN family toxin of toxin-antitoxin system